MEKRDEKREIEKERGRRDKLRNKSKEGNHYAYRKNNTTMDISLTEN